MINEMEVNSAGNINTAMIQYRYFFVSSSTMMRKWGKIAPYESFCFSIRKPFSI